MSNRIVMPDAESLRILIELTKENPVVALAFLSFMQSELIYELTEGAE